MKDLLGHMPNKGFFTLKQCIYSPLAQKNEINNFPGSDYSQHHQDLSKDKIFTNMHKLFKYCVNPIYRRFNTIGLSSVYRNKKINELMGGVKHSQHIYGYAADITSNHPNIKTSEIFNWCILNLPLYHQLIWEYPERGSYGGTENFSWIHISYIEGNNWKENSVSSLDPKIHEFYKDSNTYTIGNFTHGIKEANQDLIEI